MICVIPLRTKLISFLNRPAWAKFGFRLLSVFLNKDMKGRVFMVHDKRQAKDMVEIVGRSATSGRGKKQNDESLLSNVPAGFAQLDKTNNKNSGSASSSSSGVVDLLKQTYDKQVKERQQQSAAAA